jgi:hypothetical protein
MNLKQTVRNNKKYQLYIDAKMNLKRFTNLELTWIKDEKGGLLADSHNILSIQNNYFCQLLNVGGVITLCIHK